MVLEGMEAGWLQLREAEWGYTEGIVSWIIRDDLTARGHHPVFAEYQL